MSAKILVVGLDAFEPSLVKMWSEEGELPHLAELTKKGRWGYLRSVPNMNSAPAWSSFATGVNPGKHGIYYFTEIPERTYCRRLVNAGDRKAASFWSYLSQQGLSVGIVNVPISYPAEPVNGFLVAGMDAPNSNAEGFSYPDGFYSDVAQNLSEPYVIEPMIGSKIREKNYETAMQMVRSALKARLEFVNRALLRCPVDVLVTVFTAADVAQHFFWRFMDQGHPQYKESVSDEVRNFVKEIYGRLDKAVGELIEVTCPDLVLLLSDHGAGFNQRGGDFLYEWLVKVGLLKEWQIMHKPKWLGPSCSKGTSPWPILQNVAWRQTRAYAVGTDDIYLNLRSRDPLGQVLPASKDKLIEHITDLLEDSVDPVTKEPIIDYIAPAAEIYDGPHTMRAPDITIRWRTKHVLNGIATPGFEPVIPDGPLPLINGGHRLLGTLVVAGRGIEAKEKLLTASIMDVAPTILHWLELPIPSSYDGKVLTEVFTREWCATHPIVHTDYRSMTHPEQEHSEDHKAVEDRLRDLGYID
jgi:predicted AlkP superfamily phosphohydrolase/phosphomutase